MERRFALMTRTVLSFALGLANLSCSRSESVPTLHPAVVANPDGTSDLAMSVSSPCSIVIPGAENSVPAWAGRRTSEPFNVKERFFEWNQKYNAEAECHYLMAMVDFNSELAQLVKAEIRDAQLARQTSIVKRLIEIDRDSIVRWSNWNEIEVREFLNASLPAMAKIDMAQRHPTCIFSSSLQFSSSVPHLQAVRAINRYARIAIEASRRAGGEEDAIENVVRRMLRLSRDVKWRGIMIQQLVAYTTEHYVLDSICYDLLNNAGVTANQCLRLYELIEQHEKSCIDSLIEGVHCEYIMAGNTLWGLERELLTFKEIDAENISPQMAQTIDYEVEWRALDELFTFTLGEFLKEPYYKVLKRDRYHERLEEMRDAITTFAAGKSLRGGKLTHSLLVVLVAPGLGKFREASARREVKLGAVKSLLMIRHFELMHRRLPKTLNEAFDIDDSGILPDDPYSGGKLKYRVIDNMIRVYSTGSDQQDDQAVLDWKYGEQPGDFFLEMPVMTP